MGKVLVSSALCAVLTLLHVGLSFQALMTVPDHIVQELKKSGAEKLGAEVTKIQKDFDAALNAFIPVNKTCNNILQSKTSKCTTCVENACKHRAEKACSPSKWQALLSKGMSFFSKGIPNLLAKTFSHVSVDALGKAVVNVGSHIEDFFTGSLKHVAVDVGKTIEKGAVDIGKNVLSGVVNVGKEIGHVGEEIGHGVVHVGEEIGHGVINLGKEIGNIGENIGHEVKHIFSSIGHIFGRRRDAAEIISLMTRAGGEPGCDAIQHDGCNYYYHTCHDCTLDPSKECPGYTTALEKAKAAEKAQSWLADVTDWTYYVVSVKVDGTSFDPASYGYKKVEVSLKLFGKTLTFHMRKPVNPYNPVAAGPAIAAEAMALFPRK